MAARDVGLSRYMGWIPFKVGLGIRLVGSQMSVRVVDGVGDELGDRRVFRRAFADVVQQRHFVPSPDGRCRPGETERFHNHLSWIVLSVPPPHCQSQWEVSS